MTTEEETNKLITQNTFLKITQTFSEKLYGPDFFFFFCLVTNKSLHSQCTALLRRKGKLVHASLQEENKM